jgi:hypothetical protein
MVRGKDETVGDTSLRTATGRGAEEWFALLDAAGSRTSTHAAIARWLVEEHGVPGWWAQGITVQYEQARGMRVPGQRADGTFAASASTTVDGPLDTAYARMVGHLTAALGGPVSARATGARPSARWAAAAGSIHVTAETVRGRIRIAAVHERLPDAGDLPAAKAALAALLRGVGSERRPDRD